MGHNLVLVEWNILVNMMNYYLLGFGRFVGLVLLPRDHGSRWPGDVWGTGHNELLWGGGRHCGKGGDLVAISVITKLCGLCADSRSLAQKLNNRR